MAGPGAAEAKSLERAAQALDGLELPYEGEHHYYKNFSQFKGQVDGVLGRVKALLGALPGAAGSAEGLEDPDDAKEWAAGLLEETYERVDDAIAAAREARKRKAEGPAAPSPAGGAGGSAAGVTQQNRSPAAAASKRARANGGFISYLDSHLTIRPQEAFEDKMDNSNSPFRPRMDHLVALGLLGEGEVQEAAEGESAPHPLEARLEALRYTQEQLEASAHPPQFPRSYDETPFEFVDTLPALRATAARLAAAKEIAIDLEAHSYRSFQGFCCLIQLSTRAEDIIIDALAMRSHLGTELGPVFADPAVVKVLHGSDSDVVWLQRDFGLYLVNMFDTGQAARVLEFPGHGLAYLLEKYCGFKADKRFQLADWRVRPLTQEMLHYARSDTHFLLYCYDKLRAELAARGDRVPEALQVELPSEGPLGALGTVLERSRRLCLLRYEKELLRPDSWICLLSKIEVVLTEEQMAAFAGLYAWRDEVARQEDESTGYVLSRANLVKLAQAVPTTVAQVHRAVGRGAPLVSRRAAQVVDAVKAAVARSAEYAAMRRAALERAADAREQQRQQRLAAHQQLAPLQQATQQPAAEAAAAAAAAPAAPRAPALQPRAVKPLQAAAASGGLLGAQGAAPSTAAAGAPAPPRIQLQPRAVKPLMLGGGGASAMAAGGGAGGLFGAGTAPAAPAAPAVPAAPVGSPAPAAAAQEPAAQQGAPAEDEEAPAQSKAAEPQQQQQKPEAGQKQLGEQQQSEPAAAQPAAPAQAAASRAPKAPLLAAGPASAFGSMLGGGAAAGGSAVHSLKAGMVLPFAFAKQQEPQQVQREVGAAQRAAAAAEGDEDGGAQQAQQAQQRAQIRAAMDALIAEGPQGQEEPPPQQAQHGAAGAAEQDSGSEAGEGEAEGRSEGEAQQEETAATGARPAGDPLSDFLPLPVSQRFGRGGGRRGRGGGGGGRGRGFPRPKSRQQEGGDGGSGGREEGQQGRHAAVGEGPKKEQQLKRTLQELGLEGDSDSDGQQLQQKQAQRDGKRTRQQAQRAPADAAGFDPQEARAKFDLGIRAPASAGRGRGGGRGERGRGRGGRGGDRGRGGRDGRGGGRGGGGGKEPAEFKMPAGKFNPYGELDLSRIKGGKRSGVMPRSGNRSYSYK